MAKKKGTHQPHPHPSQSLDLKQHHPTVKAMDDPSVQIQNLKKLNSVLLMETTQRRQQLESLLHTGDTNLVLDLENAVLLAFVETQMREMGFRFDEVVGEMDERGYEVAVLEGELKCRENEREQLKDELVAGAKRLMETENRERMVRDEVENLRLEGERLLEQRLERERVIEQLKEDKDFALRNSRESAMVIEMLKVEIEGVMREKNEIERLNQSQVLKIIGLENELKQLHESLKSTAAFVCQYKEGAEVVVSNERKLEEEIQPYAKELDAIRNAFKSKDEMVDDMKQQVVSLHKSVAKAHKSKSLWTLISSATTIFAAAAFAAYVVARGR